MSADAAPATEPVPKGALPAPRLRALYRAAVESRLADERADTLLSQGRIPFHVAARGEEVAQATIADALRPDDWIFPSHRSSHVARMRGVPLRSWFDALVQNVDDPSLGRGLPGHGGFPSANVVAITPSVSARIPQAAGVALAMQLQQQVYRCAVVFCGPGVAAGGDFVPGLAAAVRHNVPLVLACIDVPARSAALGVASGPSVVGLAHAVGLSVTRIGGDGRALKTGELAAAAADVRDDVIGGAGPALLYVTVGDNDPLVAIRAELERTGEWSAKQDSALLTEVRAQVKLASDGALAASRSGSRHGEEA